MSADFWLGCFVGSAFLLVAVSLSLALSKRMSAEHRAANTATMQLLKDANWHRDDIRVQLVRIANELERQGGRK